MLRVGVCEDDAAVRATLTRALRSAGHEVVPAHDGGEATRVFPTAALDVLIVDIGLPDADGRDVCLALRAGGLSAPVLMLTARDGVHDKVAGFEAGADDYLTKPYEVAELLVRVSALARRTRPAPTAHGDIELDASRHAVRRGDRAVALTPTEFRLLARLLGAPDEVVRRRALVAAAWPMGAQVSDNTLDSYIRRLRTKLEYLSGAAEGPGDTEDTEDTEDTDDTEGTEPGIRTVRGVGYAWR